MRYDRPPRSTYRLQLGPDLTFAEAATVADYLADLGVSHAYLSPVLPAAPGSKHGYDVVNHAMLSPELGGADGFAVLSRALARRGIGVVLDVVPNHMAIPVPESANPALWSVLREGRASRYAHWFDIDWPAGGDRLVLPILDGSLTDNLARLRIEQVGGESTLCYFDHRLPLAEGTAQLPLDRLVERQHYRLADWREAAATLNYRRFMDITTLIGLRMEDPAVFSASHALIGNLVSGGAVDALRIDHPDGLADPAGYLGQLAELTGGEHWVVVEKVLGTDEPVPPDWATAGTTGYRALAELNTLLVDPAAREPLSELYTELTGHPSDFADVARGAKRLVCYQLLWPEVNRLARLLGARAGRTAGSAAGVVAGRDEGSDGSEQGSRACEALVEVFCGLPVYRPYPSSSATLAALDEAILGAAERRPELREQVEAVRQAALAGGEFAVRFAQTAAAVYAKGVEDTAFYRFARLLSLNEVGGDPGRFGSTVPEFHRFAAALHQQRPQTMTTLSTHDTKRSEDVRARIAVLSELPDEWADAVRRWLRIGKTLGCPDPHFGYVFWQILVGAWPLDADRAQRYMTKAVREAKLMTSWYHPDARYERAVTDFVTAVFNDDGLLADVGMFVATIEPAAAANSLAQKLIQLTMPGVPDVYQGCELATFTLVDPDNRGPVDFGVRREALRSLLDDKLRVTATALRLRRDHPDWFADYRPLFAEGAEAHHVVAFARSDQAITLAARLTARLRRSGGWRDTTVTLPDGSWVDTLSGRERVGGRQPVAELLGSNPVALLVPGVSLTN